MAKEGVRPTLDRVDLEISIEPGPLGSSTEQGEQRLGEGQEHEQAVTACFLANPGLAQSHAKAQILLIAERLFNREASAIELDERSGATSIPLLLRYLSTCFTRALA